MERIIHGFWASPFFSLAAQAILEANLPFEYKRVSPFAGDTYHAEYRACNPLFKIPSLKEIDGTIVYESQTIVRYLARTYPAAKAIYPIDDVKACVEVDSLDDFISFSIGAPLFNWIVVGAYIPKALQLNCAKESDVFSKFSLIRVKDAVDRLLAISSVSPFLITDIPMMPDFHLYQLLEAARVFSKIFNMPKLNLLSWSERLVLFHNAMKKRPSSKKILAYQAAELPLTKKEMFEMFSQVVGPIMRESVSEVFGFQV